MVPDILDFPEYGSQDFVTHLLRHGNAVALYLSIGVIGAETDENTALPSDQDEFHLAAGVTAADFDAIARGQPPCGDTIVDWSASRTSNADGFQFGDVLVTRDRIAPGPPGDHCLVDRQGQRGRGILGIDGECEIKHG